MYQISDGTLTVTISPVGAEVVSIKDGDGLERIWQGDPQIWGRHAPLLFPFIGRLREGQYELEGQRISIPTHGFARDMTFAVSAQSGSAITFALEDTEETRQVYPFSFRLEVIYSLEAGVLTKTHAVTNRSQREMPFEMGGHDGYCTTLLPGETMADYYLEFPGLDTVEPHLMESGTCFVAEGKEEIPLKEGKWWNYREFLARMDTAVLDRLPVNRVTLGSRKSGKKVTVSFEEFDYLGIWTATKDFDTNYVCIEPWSTLPECTTTGPSIWGKKGIQRVKPGETKTLRYSMEII